MSYTLKRVKMNIEDIEDIVKDCKTRGFTSHDRAKIRIKISDSVCTLEGIYNEVPSCTYGTLEKMVG